MSDIRVTRSDIMQSSFVLCKFTRFHTSIICGQAPSASDTGFCAFLFLQDNAIVSRRSIEFLQARKNALFNYSEVSPSLATGIYLKVFIALLTHG